MESSYSTSSIAGRHVVDNNSSNVINVGKEERLLSVAVGFLLLTAGIKRSSFPLSLLGGYLLYRGASGNSPVYTGIGKNRARKTDAVNIRATIVVNKPRQEVYDFWRKLENLPKFMTHLNHVTELSEKRSLWEAKGGPGNLAKVSWEAEIVKEENGSLISWRSLEKATIENAGKVEFRDFMNHKGTEIDVVITYRPPAGNVGSGLAWLFNGKFEKMIKEDIRNFKQYIETGVVPEAKMLNA